MLGAVGFPGEEQQSFGLGTFSCSYTDDNWPVKDMNRRMAGCNKFRLCRHKKYDNTLLLRCVQVLQGWCVDTTFVQLEQVVTGLCGINRPQLGSTFTPVTALCGPN